MLDDDLRERAQVLALKAAASGQLVVIVGPTASGKTELALHLAERLGGEIVGADSVQIYRHFELGSGKPTLEERARVPHHGIDLVEPSEHVDAARFARLARDAIEDVRGRGRLPIVCGGTFFWIRSLVFGLVHVPQGDAQIRERHEQLVHEKGLGALHAALAAVDPTMAERLHVNDRLRVSRALEVYELTGRPMSLWQKEHGFRSRAYSPMFVGIRVPNDLLTERIACRVDVWLSEGWVEHVHDLCAAGHGDTRAMNSVGYKEVCAFVQGRMARDDLRGAIVRSTRTFARRQRTWLNGVDVAWL